MAYLAVLPLITRIREVLEQSKGVARTVPVGRFEGDLPQGLTEMEQMRRAMVTPRVRVNVTTLGRHPQSPPINSNIIIYAVQVQITSLRTIIRDQQLSDDLYDQIQALGIEDGDIIRQALEFPRNLLTTEDGAATNLVSGMLSYDPGSSFQVMRDINAGAQKLESVHTFTGAWLDYPDVP